MQDFAVLSDIEFEELAADLLAAEFAVPVERFARGPDGGIDLRWRSPRSSSLAIGQCKHYVRSTFSHLLSAARAEVDHVKRLNPVEYRFLSSFDLTTGQKQQIFELFAAWMSAPDDVMGARDIDGLITRHPAVEQRHAKLWLSSGAQLFWATHSAIANRSIALRDRIDTSLPLYVVNRVTRRLALYSTSIGCASSPGFLVSERRCLPKCW